MNGRRLTLLALVISITSLLMGVGALRQSSGFGMLRDDASDFEGCRGGSGYIGQSADFKVNFICTPDGVLHRIVAP